MSIEFHIKVKAKHIYLAAALVLLIAGGIYVSTAYGTSSPEEFGHTNSEIDITSALNMENQKIINLADPSDPQDASTRSYVQNYHENNDKTGSIPQGTTCGCSDGTVDSSDEFQCGGLDPANNCPDGWEQHQYRISGGDGAGDGDVLCGHENQDSDVYICIKK